MSDDLRDALRRAGLPVDAPTTRLAGLTNINHLVTTTEGRFVLRIPGAGTSEYIDRAAEEVAARSAAAAGVNAEVVMFDPTDGLMVTRFVDGATTMDPVSFRDLGAVARAAQVIHRLHHTAAPFAVDFDLFGSIDGFRRLLTEKSAPLPDGYAALEARAEQTREVLERGPRRRVPSHCDPLCENFLDTGARMYLIDYEYSGNNDPMWDLGDVSVEGGFTDEQDQVLLRAYFSSEPPAAEIGRMTAYKAMCDLLWTLWGVLQYVNDNPAEDFWAYATGRFTRCATLMDSPEFTHHLGRIAGG